MGVKYDNFLYIFYAEQIQTCKVKINIWALKVLITHCQKPEKSSHTAYYVTIVDAEVSYKIVGYFIDAIKETQPFYFCKRLSIQSKSLSVVVHTLIGRS